MEQKPRQCDIRKAQILRVLVALCSEQAASNNMLQLPPPAFWPKTRELADRCDEDIYSARALLIALKKEGKIHCFPRRVNNSLRCFIREEK